MMLQTKRKPLKGEALAAFLQFSDWYVFEHTDHHIANGETADVATDHWHRYSEDLALATEIGVNSVGTSIAWERTGSFGYLGLTLESSQRQNTDRDQIGYAEREGNPPRPLNHTRSEYAVVVRSYGWNSISAE